ncbi:hypothetical protein NQ318_011953 [Aromia moschata]|uniref:non-specific serine/threonine protein kinase n=1 Tax=Aromia moschata TaxID=1265417 RepID=A0AAV8XM75_9CUCU|nr:hypothetical protein NQ318_011953 [Aromia moschata]
MSRNNLNGSRSVSSNSFNSLMSDSEIIDSGLEDLSLGSKGNRPSSTSRTQKAKRVRFYHNGNKFFNGVVIPVAPERYRSFDSLTSELTNILTKSVTLPSGVRNVYSMDGKKVCAIDDLEDGKEYVVSGKGELFKKIEYTKTDTLRPKRLSNTKFTIHNSTSPKVISPDCVRPRIVTIIRNGIKPRKMLRLLLNKRNSSSMEQVAQLAVRKVFTLSGQSVSDLPQFFASEDIFFVYGNERPSPDDFELEFEESKAIQQYKRTPGLRNGAGPKPKMPKKELNRTYESEESLLKKLSEDNNITLPPSLRKYCVGRTIGDGNFAVVRLCKDTLTNKEYALKIIVKSKCKGKEDMIENEVKILRKVTHPNIMALIAEQDLKHMLYLVCEYITGGDLFDAITVAQKFSEEQASLMINHLVSALAYLHNLNIVHRDVKPENLLVELDGSRVKYLKLGDFGLACEVTGATLYSVRYSDLRSTGDLSRIWIWPQDRRVGRRSDPLHPPVRLSPFVSQDNDQEKLFDCILSGQYDFPEEYWHETSSLAKELIQNMLQLAPELRFSAEDVLDHPWLQLAGC